MFCSRLNLILAILFLSLPALATPTRDSLHSSDATEYHHIFEVNTEANTDDAFLGDGVCADEAGACSLKAALDELYQMESDALVTGPILIRLLVDTIEWDGTVATSSVTGFHGWFFADMTLTIRGYERSTKSGQSRWITPERIRVLNFGRGSLWLDNFEIYVSENRSSHYLYGDFSLFQSNFSNGFSARITRVNAIRNSNLEIPSFFRFFEIHGSLATEDPTANLRVSNSSFTGFGLPISESGEIVMLVFPDFTSELDLDEYILLIENLIRGGTFLLTRTDATFKRTIIERSATSSSGGGIYIGGGNCSLDLNQTVFRENQTYFIGGAIAINSETPSDGFRYDEGPLRGEISNCNAKIENSEFIHNRSLYGAAIDFTGTGDIEIQKTKFEYNNALREGVLFFRSNSRRDPGVEIKLSGNRFQFNNALENGVIAVHSVLSFEIKNSNFFQNTSGENLIYLSSIGDYDFIEGRPIGLVIFDDVEFIENAIRLGRFPARDGSLIEIWSANDVYMTNSVFRNNTFASALLHFELTDHIHFNRNSVLNNRVFSSSGNIIYFDTTFYPVSIQNSQILNNRFSGDSAIRYDGIYYCNQGRPAEDCLENGLSISNTEVAYNRSRDSEVAVANGLYVKRIPLKIENSYFHHNGDSSSLNSALNGALVYEGPQLEIVGSTFSQNHGDEIGGIKAEIYSLAPPEKTDDVEVGSLITNSTISQNLGVGLKVEARGENSQVDLNYSTIILNQKTDLGQAAGLITIAMEGALILSEGMLIYQNQCASDRNCDCFALPWGAYSVGNNLISENYLDCSLNRHPDFATADQTLDPAEYSIEDILNIELELNGASLTPSHALVADSPAINSEEIITPLDTCSDIGFDQTGFTRFAFFDRVCDRGAVEHRAAEFSRF